MAGIFITILYKPVKKKKYIFYRNENQTVYYGRPDMKI